MVTLILAEKKEQAKAYVAALETQTTRGAIIQTIQKWSYVKKR